LLDGSPKCFAVQRELVSRCRKLVSRKPPVADVQRDHQNCLGAAIAEVARSLAVSVQGMKSLDDEIANDVQPTVGMTRSSAGELTS
jgi:hypothetical protein